jgi:hypothetical protein
MFDLTGVRAGEFRKLPPGEKLPREPDKARETTCRGAASKREQRDSVDLRPVADLLQCEAEVFMSKINGEKARAAVNNRRRTARRAKDRSKRAELQKKAAEEAPKAQEK